MPSWPTLHTRQIFDLVEHGRTSSSKVLYYEDNRKLEAALQRLSSWIILPDRTSLSPTYVNLYQPMWCCLRGAKCRFDASEDGAVWDLSTILERHRSVLPESVTRSSKSGISHIFAIRGTYCVEVEQRSGIDTPPGRSTFDVESGSHIIPPFEVQTTRLAPESAQCGVGIDGAVTKSGATCYVTCEPVKVVTNVPTDGAIVPADESSRCAVSGDPRTPHSLVSAVT